MSRRARTVGIVAGAIAAVGAGAMAALAVTFSSTTSNPSNTFSAATLAPPTGLTATQQCAGAGAITYVGSSTTWASGSNLSLTMPTGVAEGDLLLVGTVSRFGEVVGTPTGWTELRSDAPGIRQQIFYKVAGASEPASYTFTNSGRTSAAIVAYRGVSTSNPIDIHGGQGQASQNITAPSVTTATASGLLVGVFGIRASDTVTVPGSMDLRATRATADSGSNTHQTRVTIGDQTLGAAGATGTRVATSTTSESNVGALVALRQQSTLNANLSWTATTSTYATGYELQRWAGGVQQASWTLTPRTTVSYADTTSLSSGTTYTYKLHSQYGTWTSTQATATLNGSC